MTELYQAKYLLALANNEVNEQIRNDFISSISSKFETNYDNIFINIVQTVLDSLKNIKAYTAVTAKLIIENEFVSLGLSKFYGDFSQFNNLFDLILEAKTLKYVSAEKWIELGKSFINIADNMKENYKTDIYYAVLCFLVRRKYILEDINFTKKVVSYLDINRDEISNHAFVVIVSSAIGIY